MGDAVIGTVTAHVCSADHDSAMNNAFVAAFRKANDGMRLNFMVASAEERRSLRCRVRHFSERERSDQGCREEVTTLPA
jgi:hypothetical protein